QVGVPGEGALGEDAHTQPAAQRLPGRLQRLPGGGGVAVHRDLLGLPQRPPEQRDAEQGVLGQEARGGAVVVEEVGEDERVEVRQVVACGDEFVLLWQVLGVLPFTAYYGSQEWAQDDRCSTVERGHGPD